MSEENDQEYAIGGYVRKYQAGGYVGGAENARIYKDAPLSGFEMVAMTNSDGSTIYIPYVNGTPLLPVPPGYKVRSSDTVTPSPVKIEDIDVPIAPGITGVSGDGGGDSGSGGNNANAPGVQGSFSPVTGNQVGIVAQALGVMGVPGMNIATLGKNAIANAMNTFGYNSAVSNNVNTVAAMMGLDPNDPANAAAISAAIDSTPNIGEDVGTTATTGPSGTGGSAASAAAAAAAAAADAGLSAEAQGAASQAAADATVSGASPADAAAVGAAAASSVDSSVGMAADANAVAGGFGDTSSGVSGISSDGIGFAKGGFVNKRKSEKTGKSTSFVTRQK
jgi:hypothetical protein